MSQEVAKECKEAKARKCLIPGTALTLRHRSIVGCRGSLKVVLRGILIKCGFKGIMTNVMDTSTVMGTAAESTSTVMWMLLLC